MQIKKKVRVLHELKARVLERLKPILRKSEIAQLYIFSVREWLTNSSQILSDIESAFTNPVMIRSSSSDEDQEYSNAGKFRSVSGIDPVSRRSLRNAITLVINTYSNRRESFNDSLVFVQKQVIDIETSGVLFTFDPQSGAPYYIINFDDVTHQTSTITSGKKGSLLKVFRGAENKVIPKKWRRLIAAIKEVEASCDRNNLDIEFGISPNGAIHVFQVRNLYISSKIPYSVAKYKKVLTNQKRHLIDLPLSNMSFWNPAEIVGEKPRPLAASLYNYVILERAWNRGLMQLGYTDTRQKLFVMLAGRTYINVHTAFLSLLPKNLHPNLKKRLVALYLQRLKEAPYLHDKVEFRIVPNCFNFSLEEEFRKSDYKSFSTNELTLFYNLIKEQTKEVLTRWKALLKEFEAVCERPLSQQHHHIKLNELNAALHLLRDCRDIDVPIFAATARLAFIGKSFLFSLKERGIISAREQEQISELQTTYGSIDDSKRRAFLKDRGHLRSGTYDITQLPYSQYDISERSYTSRKSKTNALSQELIDRLSRICKKSDLGITGEELIDFIVTTQSQREYIKFLFTKRISTAIELIAKVGEKSKFTRQDMSYLTLSDLRMTSAIPLQKRLSYWKRKISVRQQRKSFLDTIPLPDCILSVQDLYFVKPTEVKPNFITRKKVAAPIVQIGSKKEALTSKTLVGKIIILESADPGFDWIFEQNIAGLVTKYGGAGSHMAIRCNEYGIPAVLGCGEQLFASIIHSKSIEIDGENGKIRLFK